MRIFARKVVVTPAPKGRRNAVYIDLVQLNFGDHAGEYALVDGVLPPQDPNYIKALLTADEALERLRVWEHQEYSYENSRQAMTSGTISQVFPDGQKWLDETKTT
jgi:hypothetical protein